MDSESEGGAGNGLSRARACLAAGFSSPSPQFAAMERKEGERTFDWRFLSVPAKMKAVCGRLETEKLPGSLDVWRFKLPFLPS